MCEDYEREDLVNYYMEEKLYYTQLAEEEYFANRRNKSHSANYIEADETCYDWNADIATDDYYEDLPF